MFDNYFHDKAAGFVFDKLMEFLVSLGQEPDEKAEETNASIIVDQLLKRIEIPANQDKIVDGLVIWLKRFAGEIPDEATLRVKLKLLLTKIRTPETALPELTDIAFILLGTDNIANELKRRGMALIESGFEDLTEDQKKELAANLFAIFKNSQNREQVASLILNPIKILLSTERGSEFAASKVKTLIEGSFSAELAEELEPIIRTAFREVNQAPFDRIYEMLIDRKIKFNEDKIAVYRGFETQAMKLSKQVDEWLKSYLDEEAYKQIKEYLKNDLYFIYNDKNEKTSRPPKFEDDPIYYYSRIAPFFAQISKFLPYAGQALNDLQIILAQKKSPAERLAAIMNMMAVIKPMDELFFQGTKKIFEELTAQNVLQDFPGMDAFNDQIAEVLAIYDTMEKIKDSERIQQLVKNIFNPEENAFHNLQEISDEFKKIAHPDQQPIVNNPAEEKSENPFDEISSIINSQISLIAKEEMDEATREDIKKTLAAVSSLLEKHEQYSRADQNFLSQFLFLFNIASEINTLIQSGSKANESLRVLLEDDYQNILRIINRQLKTISVNIDARELQLRLRDGALSKFPLNRYDSYYIKAPLGSSPEEYMKNLIAQTRQYEICKMSDGLEIQEGKVYVRWVRGELLYTVRTPAHEIVLDQPLKDIPAPAKFDDESLARLKDSILRRTEKAGHTFPQLNANVFVEQNGDLHCVHIHNNQVMFGATKHLTPKMNSDYLLEMKGVREDDNSMVKLSQEHIDILTGSTDYSLKDEISLHSMMQEFSDFVSGDPGSPNRHQLPDNERPPYTEAIHAARITMASKITEPHIDESVGEQKEYEFAVMTANENFKDLLSRRIQQSSNKLEEEKKSQKQARLDASTNYLKARDDILNTLLDSAITRLDDELSTSTSQSKADKRLLLRELKQHLTGQRALDRRKHELESDLPPSLNPDFELKLVLSEIKRGRDISPLWEGRTRSIMKQVEDVMLGPDSYKNVIRLAIEELENDRQKMPLFESEDALKIREQRILAMRHLLNLLETPGIRPTDALKYLSKKNSMLYAVLNKHDKTVADQIVKIEGTICKTYHPPIVNSIFGFIVNEDIKPARQSRSININQKETAIREITNKIYLLQQKENLFLEFFTHKWKNIREAKVYLLQQVIGRLNDPNRPSLKDVLDDMAKNNEYRESMYLLHQGKTGNLLRALCVAEATKEDILEKITLEIERLRSSRTKTTPFLMFFLNPKEEKKKLEEHISALERLRTEIGKQDAETPLDINGILARMDEEDVRLLVDKSGALIEKLRAGVPYRSDKILLEEKEGFRSVIQEQGELNHTPGTPNLT